MKIKMLTSSLLLFLSFGISDVITVEGDIDSDVTWSSDNTYYLNSQAFVKDGVTLTIEAGTEIFGRYDANYSADNPAPCLVVEQGGKIKCGGKRHPFSNEGYYFPPTIIECDNHNLPVAENELFGPVLSVMKFDTEEEVIEKMNDNQYGLSSGVYTSNLARGMRVSKAIRAGITFVNTYRLISPSAPFGGIKDSGYGKEAGLDSIKDYTRVKTTWFYTSDEPTLDPFSIR